MVQAYNFLTRETLKSYSIEDTADGFAIEHKKADGHSHRVASENDYRISGLEFLELVLTHQMECGL